MSWQNKNFAYSTLDGGVLIGASSIVVTTGANFPATGNFMCVIWDQTYANPSFDSSRELVLCTARAGNTITTTRAQEGTSAKAWNSGDKVAHVYTAAILDTLVLLDETQTLTNKTLTTPVIASFYQDAAQRKKMTVPDVDSDTIALLGAAQTLVGKTLTTPTIASFVNAVHTHATAAQGGTLTNAVLGGSITGSYTLATAAWVSVSSFSNGYAVVTGLPVAYMKDPMGFVHIRGAVYKMSPAGTGETLFTLDAGYRPEQNVYPLAQQTASASAVYSPYPVQILQSTGTISTTGAGGSPMSTYVYFDTVAPFKAA